MGHLFLSICASLLLLGSGCSHGHQEGNDDPRFPVIRSVNELDSTDHQDTIHIEGYLQPYQPPSKEKGAGVQWFQYEVRLVDDTTIPVDKAVDIDSVYSGQDIRLVGVAEKVSIHDKPCPPYCQNTAPFWQIHRLIEVTLLSNSK